MKGISHGTNNTTDMPKDKRETLVPGRKNMSVRRFNAKRFAKMIELLSTGTYTLAQLAEQVDVAEDILRDYIYALRLTKPRMVRIDEWINLRTHPFTKYTAGYTLGSAPDEPRPAKKTQAQVCAEYRARRKAKELMAAIAGVTKHRPSPGGQQTSPTPSGHLEPCAPQS